MKTFKFLQFMLMSVLLLGFVACGGDDDEETPSKNPSNPVSLGFKKLVKMKIDNEAYGTGTEESYLFEYNKDGDLISVEWEEDDDKESFTYKWGKNELVVYCDGDLEFQYEISDGKIVAGEQDSEVYEYQYDSNGYIETYVESDEYEQEEEVSEFKWSDDRLSRVVKTYSDLWGEYETVYSFVYSTKECEGFFPLIGERFNDDDPLCYAAPWMFGAVQQSLPNKVKIADDGSSIETRTYSYTYDDDGYLKSCTIRNDDGYKKTYRFTWE